MSFIDSVLYALVGLIVQKILVYKNIMNTDTTQNFSKNTKLPPNLLPNEDMIRHNSYRYSKIP